MIITDFFIIFKLNQWLIQDLQSSTNLIKDLLSPQSPPEVGIDPHPLSLNSFSDPPESFYTFQINTHSFATEILRQLRQNQPIFSPNEGRLDIWAAVSGLNYYDREVKVEEQLIIDMQAIQNKHRRYRGFKVDEELARDKNASLGYSKEQIEQHCIKVTSKEPSQLSNCLNMNFTAQKYYIDCYQALQNREQCIRNLKFEVDQNGMYRLRYLKTD